MAALTADRTRSVKGEPFGSPFGVAASATLFGGGITLADANGFAVSATDTAGLALLGISACQVDNSAGANGDETVVCERGHAERLAHTGLVQADVGKNVFVLDDQTVGDALAATNDVKAGTLVGFEDGDAIVLIGVFADVDA